MPNPSNATLFNPAQLSAMPEDEGFAIGLSSGARAYDPDETIETLEDSSDTIDQIDAIVAKGTGNYTNEDFDELDRLARHLDGQFSDADENVAQIEAGGAVLLSRPNKALGLGLTSSAQLYLGGTLDYTSEDSDALNQLADDAENRSADVLNFDGDALSSQGHLLGVGIGEFGVTFSQAMTIAGREYAIGITPKAMKVETIFYKENIANTDSDDFDADKYRTSYSDANVDLGAMTSFGNLQAGLTIKNLISREYETAEVRGDRLSRKLGKQRTQRGERRSGDQSVSGAPSRPGRGR